MHLGSHNTSLLQAVSNQQHFRMYPNAFSNKSSYQQISGNEQKHQIFKLFIKIEIMVN